MAATKTTRNKLNRARLIAYWWAQDQAICRECDKPLLNGRLSDVDELTVHHKSGAYDHIKRCERKPNGKRGVELMHSSCHKSMTMKANKVWRHRHLVSTKKAQ